MESDRIVLGAQSGKTGKEYLATDVKMELGPAWCGVAGKCIELCGICVSLKTTLSLLSDVLHVSVSVHYTDIRMVAVWVWCLACHFGELYP